MKCCRNCNTELTEQARFCNICGNPRTQADPQEELLIPSKETPVKTHRCQKCGAELPTGANFCNVCGMAQSSKASSMAVSTSKKQEARSSAITDNNSKSSSPPLPKSIIPTRSIHPGSKAASTAQIILSSPAIPELTKQSDTSRIVNEPTISNSEKAAHFSSTPTQAAVESSVPDRIPGLIRPVTPKSPARSDLLSRPDSQVTALATHTKNQKPTSQLARNQKTTVALLSRQVAPMHDFEELPTSDLSTGRFNGQNGLADTPTMELVSPESFIATSKAAEHWRKSWLDRQYAEAGPAENVSRGQASVPMPLLAKRQSFARMRAIARNNKQQHEKRRIYFGTWITFFLMICLIGGLAAYIILSFLPNSPFGTTRDMQTANVISPTLTVQGTTSQTIKIGQTILLHGEQFGANHTITFLLDMVTPIMDDSGRIISIHASSQGTFDTTLSIGSTWTTGSHSIEAVDNGSNRNAFMTVQVIPAGTPVTSSTELSVTMNNKAVELLTFKAVIGQASPAPQRITITNKSGVPLKWTAAASSSKNLSWLNINDNNTFGQLDISQPHDMLISVNTVGLTSNTKTPYTGQIVFTLNNDHLLTVPVQLWVSDATPEMVFSPNPIIAKVGTGSTCNSGVTLTLINLGTATISWAVNPDENVKGNIQFVGNYGQILESGTLLPSGLLLPTGQPGDSVVLTLRCYKIQANRPYHVSVYANQMQWSEYVFVQN